jgi:RNA polymerase sigma factor (sigma-70 family)
MTEELVVQARRGDHAAFERLAAASIDRLYAIAQRVLRDSTAAEDAVQECLFRAWRDLRALREPSRWEAWLYRLLLNCCRDEQRRTQRGPVTIELARVDRGGEEAGLRAIEGRDEVERGFRGLSVDHRMVLALHFYLDLRPTEIADLLGIAEGTASSRIHYAGRALRAVLDSETRTSSRATGSAE